MKLPVNGLKESDGLGPPVEFSVCSRQALRFASKKYKGSANIVPA